jgi:DegV family protein with EDD domain
VPVVVAIVADSAANLPGVTVRELGIEVVPMYLNLGDRVFRDGADLTPEDFYVRLLRDRERASTSTPSPGDYLEAFERTGQSEVLCVTVAASMSSSNHQAVMAAGLFDGRVEVIDSSSASMGEGFVAMEAARRAATGASLEEVAERARQVAGLTNLYATVDTFEFLRRSGRVTKLQAWAATVLDIKPVFGFRGGDISPVARPRTRRRAIEVVIERSLAEIRGMRVHLGVFHAAAQEDAAQIAARIGARANIVESVMVAVTPVIGAHTGPGLVGTAFYCEGA